jgi:hypothetical protein
MASDVALTGTRSALVPTKSGGRSGHSGLISRFPLCPWSGKSSEWTRPSDSGGPGTFHFCPECGSTVYWELSVAPDVFGVAVGNFTDPTFPPPKISGYEKYGHPWAMNPSAIPMDHYDVR